jgi:hypothetical protein
MPATPQAQENTADPDRAPRTEALFIQSEIPDFAMLNPGYK